MNKGQFVDHIANEYSCTKTEAQKVIDRFTFSVIDAIVKGNERIGCFLFNKENKKFPSYVAEKLNLDQNSDAGNIADWLNIQFGFKTQEFGFYHDNFCVDCFSKQEQYIIIGIDS